MQKYSPNGLCFHFLPASKDLPEDPYEQYFWRAFVAGTFPPNSKSRYFHVALLGGKLREVPRADFPPQPNATTFTLSATVFTSCILI